MAVAFDPGASTEFLLGEHRVRPLAGEVERAGVVQHLEPKVMDVLVCLARAGGAVVTRAALLDAVWPGVVVSDEALTRCISQLRFVLGDDREPRRVLRTVPKRGYALLLRAHAIDPASAAPGSSPVRPARESVAVLPFADLSAGRDFGWFADGLTEDLIDALARFEGLHVAARTSAFALRDSARDARGIGERLGVRHVLEGSVRRAGERLRVTARLASTSDGFQLWSETFERELRDVFAVQAEIARAVALRLALRLSGDWRRSERGGTAHIDSYDAYLRGRAKYQTEQPGFGYGGIAELERAIALDPDFASAHGLHAYIHALSAAVSEPYPALAPIVRESVRRALAIDPLQPEALMAKAIDVRWRSWDWAEVRALFEQALRVAPGDAHVLTQLAVRVFRDTDQLDVAAHLLRRAIDLDPLNAAPRASLSYVLRYAGDPEGALLEAERALALNPTHGWAKLARAFAMLSAGRFGEAHRAIEALEASRGPEHPATLEIRGRLEVARGDEGAARATLARLEALARGPGGALYTDAAAWVRLELRDLDEGIDWLERGLDAGMSAVVAARVCAHPLEARRPGLLRDPRFQRFLRRMRLDDASLAELRASGSLAEPRL